MITNSEKQYWSMTEGVFNCLIDTKRSEFFIKAINETISDGDVVVDLGTGSGVLAMAAARAGAKKVYAVEIDPKNILTLSQTIKTNGLERVVEIIPADATTVTLPEKVDVITCEMVATGLIEELQIPAMNNALAQANPDVKVILNQYECFIDLVSQNSKYYGFDFPITRYEYPDDENLAAHSYSDKVSYLTVKMDRPFNQNEVIFSKALQVTAAGEVNGLRLSGLSTFINGEKLDSTFAYSYPIILPIEKLAVNPGDQIQVGLNYNVCGGFNSLKYHVEIS